MFGGRSFGYRFSAQTLDGPTRTPLRASRSAFACLRSYLLRADPAAPGDHADHLHHQMSGLMPEGCAGSVVISWAATAAGTPLEITGAPLDSLHGPGEVNPGWKLLEA